MNEAKDIILIPHWIHETLIRHSRPIEDALNFGQMRKIISIEDLVGWMILNRAAHHVGLSDANSELGLITLESAWCGTVDAESSDYLYNVASPMASLTQFKLDLHNRLFTADSASPQYEEAFNIYDLAREHVGVVINPGFFTGEEGSHQHIFALIEAIVKALYVNAPLHEVAQSSVFLRYLDLLSEKRIVV